MSTAPHSLHHVNVPIKDAQRTTEWYGKVFGMKEIPRTVRQGGAPGVEEVLLLTRGNFDLHFTIHQDPVPDIKPHHFCVEVEDWEGFMAHLQELGIETFGYFERPQNQSKATYMYDPDGNLVELAWHGAWNHESPRPQG
jgi:catechol 2,3-dioxygenase-like lactoylglutathione lyase family enzyme